MNVDNLNTENIANIINRMIESGDIRNQAELVQSLGFSKGAISNILSGNKKAGAEFVLKFQQHYQHKLSKDNIKNTSGIPIYDTVGTASGNENINQSSETPLYYDKISGYEDCDFGMFVYGHSMYPTIESGCKIVCKRIKDKSVIMFGEIYLVKTADYLMVKRLQKSGIKGCVLCISDNEASDKKYQSFDLSIDKIMELFIIKGIIKKIQS